MHINTENVIDKKIDIKRLSKNLITGLIGGIFLITIIYRSIFFIGQSENAIVYNFGKEARTVEKSGPHFKLFWETREKYPSRNTVVSIPVGYVELGKQKTELVKSEAEFLTADSSIANVEIILDLYVTDGLKYKHYSNDVVDFAKQLSVKNSINIASRYEYDFLSKTGRTKFESELQSLLKDDIKNKDLGIDLYRVRVQDITPPDSLIKVYSLVTDANKQAEQIKTTASQENDTLSQQVNSEINQIETSADTKADTIVNEAKGDTSEYMALWSQAQINRQMTEKQMVSDILQKLLTKAKIIFVDKNSTNVIYTNGQAVNVTDTTNTTKK